MAGRYLLSGTQLGTLLTLCDNDPKKCKTEINKIIDKQFLGNSIESIPFDMVRLSGVFQR